MTHDIFVFCAGMMLAQFIDEIIGEKRTFLLIWCSSFFAFDAWQAWG